MTREPTHIGVLLIEMRNEMKITTLEFSERLGVSKSTLGNILTRRCRLQPEMALRLALFFGNTIEFWLNLQKNIDLHALIQKREYVSSQIKPWKSRKLKMPGEDDGT